MRTKKSENIAKNKHEVKMRNWNVYPMRELQGADSIPEDNRDSDLYSDADDGFVSVPPLNNQQTAARGLLTSLFTYSMVLQSSCGP